MTSTASLTSSKHRCHCVEVATVANQPEEVQKSIDNFVSNPRECRDCVCRAIDFHGA